MGTPAGHLGDRGEILVEVQELAARANTRGLLRELCRLPLVQLVMSVLIERREQRKLVSLSGFGEDKMTSLAELAVIYAGPKLNEKREAIDYDKNRSATPDIDEGPGKRPLPSPTPRHKPQRL